MKHFLVTNDDGYQSPFYELLVSLLKEHARLTLVAPLHEQSWKGKSMTRFGTIEERQQHVAALPCYALNGTPADCTNIGIYHYCKESPNFTFSGINLGLNSGACFVWSSGTIGACLEANIANIPAVAISQEILPEDMAYWNTHRTLKEESLRHYRTGIEKHLAHCISTIHSLHEKAQRALTWSLNFPVNTNADTEILLSDVSSTTYGSCFERTKAGFEHRLKKVFPDTKKMSDWSNLQQGNITISCIDIFDLSTRHSTFKPE